MTYAVKQSKTFAWFKHLRLAVNISQRLKTTDLAIIQGAGV